MNIKKKRIAFGLLQKDVLKDTGLLSKIENGKALPCPEDIDRMARLFECSPKELFMPDEIAYFGDKVVGIKLPSESKKRANKAICKPTMTRKCFWLDRKTNEALSDAIKALGYRSMQAWFEEAVEETIKQTSPIEEEKYYVNSDIMGREEIYQ